MADLTAFVLVGAQALAGSSFFGLIEELGPIRTRSGISFDSRGHHSCVAFAPKTVREVAPSSSTARDGLGAGSCHFVAVVGFEDGSSEYRIFTSFYYIAIF